MADQMYLLKYCMDEMDSIFDAINGQRVEIEGGLSGTMIGIKSRGENGVLQVLINLDMLPGNGSVTLWFDWKFITRFIDPIILPPTPKEILCPDM